MEWEELCLGGPQPFQRRAREQVRASTPGEFLSIPWSSCPQAKFLKGAEENQVERNVLVGTVEAARRSTYGTQRTVEEKLGTHKPHTVRIEKWFCNVIIVVTLSNVEWIRRGSCQTILQWAQSDQYMYIPRIWPAYTRNILFIYHVYVFTLTFLPRNRWCSMLNG